MDIRLLESVDDLKQVVDLEIAVWGLDPKDAVPMNIMRPLSLHGGLVLGAFEAARMVGMALAFPARTHGRWLLWSHMTGVHPDVQGRGIGFALKQAQRAWALENGYDEIRWTFDPLQRGNANFNLHRLGASASSYYVNYYGQMDDAINRQTASDRIEAVWKLRDRRVRQRAEGRELSFKKKPTDTWALGAQRGEPVSYSLPSGDARVLIEIPRDRASLSAPQTGAWRLALRHALQEAFARGYAAVDFVDEAERSYYVLEASPWYLYVLHCGDDSLYTGITPDLASRLKRHQAGRGAAYTAARRPVRVAGAWRFPSRSAALKAEAAFKRLSRASKLAHIDRKLPYMSMDFVAPE